MKTLRIVAVLAAIVAILMLLSAGPGTRFGVWNFRTGLSLLRYAAYAGVVALALSILALIVGRPHGGWLAAILVAVLVSIAAVAVPAEFARRAKRVPPIHDISTDTQDPPAFVAVLPLRRDAANAATYGGDSVAALQRSGYPDIKPLELNVPPSEAYARALAAATDMGWTIDAADSTAGRNEATATTAWFGFKDDVVVRIRANGAGSRVDIRSVSRVGRSDIGTNAARIRAYLQKLSQRGSTA
jgi:uncharacterized protein (DUF1499 family)